MAEQSLSQGNSGGGVLALMQAADTLMKLTRGTTQTQTSTGRAQDNASIDALVGQIKGQVNDPAYFNSLVDSILQRSSIDFAPTRAAESASGGYNSTALQLLQNDARGRAVGESTKAITDAKTQLTQIMAQLLAQQGDMNKTTEVKTPAVGKGIVAPVAGALGAYKAYQMLTAKKPLTSMDRWIRANSPKIGLNAKGRTADSMFGDSEGLGKFDNAGVGIKTSKVSFPGLSSLDGSSSGGFSGFPTGGTPAVAPDYSRGMNLMGTMDQFVNDSVQIQRLPDLSVMGESLDTLFSSAPSAPALFDSVTATPTAPFTTNFLPGGPLTFDVPISNGPVFDLSSVSSAAVPSFGPSMAGFSVPSAAIPVSSGFSPGFSAGEMAAGTPSFTSGFSPSAVGDLSRSDYSSFNSLGSSSAGTVGTATPYSPPILGPTISLATAGERGEGGRSSAVGQVVGSALGSLLGPAGTMVGQTVGGMFGETIGNDVTGPVYDSVFSSEGDDIGSVLERGGRRLTKAGSGILDKVTGNVSVVCTELHSQGILSTEEYKREYVRSLRAHSSATWKGYRLWGIPLARKMKTSPRLVKAMAKIARSRMEYTKGNFSVTGLLVHRIVTPCCTLLGKLLEWNEARKNVTYTLVSGE